MDSFFSLFDPNCGNDNQVNESYALDHNQNALPPEPQHGNVEYKLKIVNPTKQRFEHLVTQVSAFFNFSLTSSTSPTYSTKFSKVELLKIIIIIIVTKDNKFDL